MLRFPGTATHDDLDPWEDIGRLSAGRSNVISCMAILRCEKRIQMSRCGRVDIADARHTVHLDNAPAFNRELLGFLSRPAS